MKLLKEFIKTKEFSLEKNGKLIIYNNKLPLSINKLSSGEKQLLILFIETLLQKNSNYIFIADEPELSLHIAWQRKIIESIRKLNPNCQLIVATHSPEICGMWKSKIKNMGEIVYGQ